MPADLLPCPFCGSQPVTRTDAARQIYSVECPKCVSVGFHNHFRFGCMADAQWNERANTMEEKILQHTTPQGQNGTAGKPQVGECTTSAIA